LLRGVAVSFTIFVILPFFQAESREGDDATSSIWILFASFRLAA